MTGYLLSVLPLLLTGAESMSAIFVLARRFDGRDRFFLRTVLAAVGELALVAVAALPCFYLPQTADILSAVFCVPVSVAALFLSWFCLNARFRDMAFTGSVAVAAIHISEQAARIICLSAWSSVGGWEEYVIKAGLFVPVMIATALVMRRVNPGGTENEIGLFSVFLFPISLGVTAAVGIAGLIIIDFGVIYAVVISVCGIFYGVFMLFAEGAFLVSRHSEVELSVIKSLWNEDRKHYEMQKESIEMINIKCHDLRHQLRGLSESGSPASSAAIEEIENSVYMYDSMFRTGSEVLDVVLSDYSLRCRKNAVQFTCMADGGRILFMDELDIYSLFGNMLENALEYEQKVENKEDRFISLTVRRTENGVSVHAENYYNGDPVPASQGTSKNDKLNHGFGMKSMRRIVGKYDGRMDVIIADDMFQVDIFFPERSKTGGEKCR